MSVSILKEDFTDFDHFRDILLGWDVEVTQLSRGPLALKWRQIVFENFLTLSRLILNRRIGDRMTINPGHITFVVCFSPNIFCGLEVPAGSMLVFGPGREYRSILPEGFESLEICVSSDFLRAEGFFIADEGFDDLRPENCVLRIPGPVLDEFRRLSQTISNLSSHQSEPIRATVWITAARERAMSLILSVLQASDREKSPNVTVQTSRWPLITRAFEKIDRLGPEAASIADISMSLGCTPRALQAAFQSTLGITPSQYTLAKRLHFARRDLLAAQPDKETVTRIAANHEFFHFGRFSQYYKGLFGESPSTTLKRAGRLRSDLR
jgi:AraC family ethanolamine operon transcriptional activator